MGFPFAEACAVLEDDERLASDGVSHDARTRRLLRVRTILHAWTAGTMTSEQAERALREVMWRAAR